MADKKEKGKKMKRFITFEGIDGSGKSTIINQVYNHLKKQDYSVIKTFEPTDTWLGHCVQTCIESNTNPFVTAFTFIADRIQHGKQIKKWLKDKDTLVLCDRYAESTYAYQGAQLQNLIDRPIHWLQDLSKDKILLPDRTFVFMIDPKTAIQRIQDRNHLIPFEKVAFLEKVQKNYEQLAKGDRFKQIDATATIEQITEICLNDILNH